MRDLKYPFSFDAASAITRGGREYQQDAIISDFSTGADMCFAVLSDGMGGHAAGDVASTIVLTEAFSRLTFQRTKIGENPAILTDLLMDIVQSANACLKSHVTANPETRGMGATLVICIVIKDRLHWVSVGDSPLFLFRDNVLVQLNEDHSLGPHIDLMVRSGVLSAEEGANHPERNVLTSVLAGQNTLAQIDCPTKPVYLKGGDIVILASDGLQYLTNDEITQTLRDQPMARSTDIVNALMSRLHELDDPDLDNVSLSLIQVRASVDEAAAQKFAVCGPAAPDPTVRWSLASRNAVVEMARRARARMTRQQGGSMNGI